jgi:NAD(P)-dependent dehydrogenase (short-subunit alcohol dehydrogenase family)
MLQDKIALVTGAGTGIGRTIALELAREGAAVVVADIDEQGGPETVTQIEANDDRAAFVATDVTSTNDVQEMIAFAEDHFGGLDILVNNAGGVTNAGVGASRPYYPDADPEQWKRVLDVNLYGVMLGSQYGSQSMRKREGGAIVNISSIAGIGTQPYHVPAYGAAKAGVARLTTSLATLNDDRNIRVNCICPGWVETPQAQQELAKMTPAERAAAAPPMLIQPEDIANAVLMFIRDTTLAGRVLVWPDGEPWRLLPIEGPDDPELRPRTESSPSANDEEHSK